MRALINWLTINFSTIFDFLREGGTKRRNIFNIILAVILAGLLVWEVVYSMNNTTFVDRSSAPLLRVAHNPWDTEVASAQVLGIVLEEAGYNVSLVSLDNANVFESIATGESDITTIAWLPVTHSSLYATYGNQVVDLGYNLEGARSGLAVPSYMDVDSIDELSNEAGSSVMGIEPGAGIMDMTEVAMETYDNLADWELESPSTGAMLASLADAIVPMKKNSYLQPGRRIGSSCVMKLSFQMIRN